MVYNRRVAIRKGGRESGATDLRVGRWQVQPALNQVCAGRTVRHLEPQVMDLLVFLSTHEGTVLSRDEIIQAVWDGRFISESTLTRTVADLRRTLGDDARKCKYIETIAKRGYRLVARVSSIADSSTGMTAEIEASATSRDQTQPSLVVLPFANFGPTDDRYFCEGLTDEIINGLTRFSGLRVISRTSAFAAHSQGGDISAIGNRLGVTHAIEGSVRRCDDRIRVTAQLIEVEGQSHLWSERFDRALADVFVIQDEIADAIARRLELTLGAGRRRAAAPTSDIDAYRSFLEGRHHFLKGTHESLERARQCFTEAIGRDPNFAVAHDALAELFWYLGFYGMMVPKEAFTAAVWECLRALEIDDQLAEAHGLLAMLRKELDYDWSEVDREFARAMELDSQSPAVRFRRALCGLMPHGRAAEAAAELERVVDTDPLSVVVRWWLGSMYWFSGQMSRLHEQAERMLEIDPTHPSSHMMLGTSLFAQGKLFEAVVAYEKAAELGGHLPWLLGWLGLACAAAGYRDRASALRDKLVAMSVTTYVPPFSIAGIALGLGDLDDAFRWMQRAADVRDPLIVPILCYPFLDPIRCDDRYRALLAKLKLTETVSLRSGS
jgi:serine/threonine-protein kinase